MNEVALSSLLVDELGYGETRNIQEPESRLTGRPIENVQRAFEVQEVPIAYFARLSEADPDALWQLHRRVWNESKVPILYVVLPHEIRIYNGYTLPAANPTDFLQTEKTRLLRHLTDLTDLETTRQVIHDELRETYDRFHLETGSFWATLDGQRITPSDRADQVLLRSLAHLRRKLLDDGVPREVAYRFIGRSIFICYLRDRNLLPRVGPFRTLRDADTSFEELLGSHHATYEFFEHLTDRFGGDLFPVYAWEKEHISERHLDAFSYRPQEPRVGHSRRAPCDTPRKEATHRERPSRSSLEGAPRVAGRGGRRRLRYRFLHTGGRAEIHRGQDYPRTGGDAFLRDRQRGRLLGGARGRVPSLPGVQLRR
jgi:hypothetical protein